MAQEQAPHVKALEKAKIRLMMKPDSVFFTTLAFSLRHEFSDKIPTAATNGTRIRYNPNFFMSLNEHEQIFLLLHEAMHCAYLHMLRKGDREHKRWNHACDYVINDQLIERGFKMPSMGLYEPSYKGMAAEEIYNLLPPNPADPAGGGIGDDLVGPGEPGDDGEPGSGKTPEELERQIQDILVQAAMQADMAGQPGSVPGSVRIYIESFLNPKLPWYKILAKYLKAYDKNDYTFKKPNRRYMPQHFMPSLQGQSLMSLAVAIDTSGSVSDEQFHRFISESAGIMRMLKPPRIDLLQFDTRLQGADRVTSFEGMKQIKFSGRGGTYIEPVYQWADENKPQLLLIFTDGEFHQTRPVAPKGTDVIWLIHSNPKWAAPFGKVIHYNLTER